MSAPSPLFSILRLGTFASASVPARARLVGRARVPRIAVRGISQSSASQKAIPFALNTSRAETASADGVRHAGQTLRMIMFGELCSDYAAYCDLLPAIFMT